MRTSRCTPPPHAQCGYTLVELSVSILIALFLMAGLLTLVMHTRNTSAAQSQLEQLQENQRIALTILSSVIQEAGYFPDPTTNSSSALTSETDTVGSSTLSWGSGQFVAGLTGGGTSGDTVAARFVAPIADTSGVVANTIITCQGTTNTLTNATIQFTNIFQIGTGADGTPYLQCILLKNGATPQTVNLVPGLYDMQVLYGVATGSDTNVTEYLPASAVTNWGNVTTVKIRLYFQLPQYGFSGGQVNSAATSSAVSNGTQYVERVISVMNRVGVNT